MLIILFSFFAILAPPALGVLTVTLVGSNISSTYSESIGLLLLASVCSALLGSSILCSIFIISKIAKGNRKLLLFTFKPLLKGTQLGTAVLVAFHAFTITSSVYFLEAYYIGRIHIILIGAIGLVGGLTALKVFWFSMTKFNEAETYVIGKAISIYDQPKLWTLIEEVCQITKSDLPKNIVLGLSPNFFVTESNVTTWDEELNGKTLYLSLPFARLLKSDELKAIIAHEMGHFIGQDTQFSRNFYPIYRGAQDTMDLLSRKVDENDDKGIGGIALLPSLVINSFFFENFSMLESEISRARELEADRISAKAFGDKNLAIALVKAHLYGAVWSVTEKNMAKTLAQGKKILNSSLFFESFVKTLDMEKVYEFLGQLHTEHPTDSHPPLDERLKALNFKLTLDELNQIKEEGKSDTRNIISDIELLEEELTSYENKKLVVMSQHISNIRNFNKASSAKENKEEGFHIYSSILRKMLILTAMVDGKVEDSEQESILEVYKHITGDELDQNDLIADLNSLNTWSESIFDILDKSKDILNKELKILLLKATLLIAISDNEFAESEKELVYGFAKKLGISDYDFKKTLESLSSNSEDEDTNSA